MGFRTINIGATALLTQKTALDTVGQNIANASTPGYARQRVMTEANTPSTYTYGAVGAGVGVKQISHVADEFLEKQVRLALGTKQYLDHLQNGYANLEVYFNELTENDLSSLMNEFWDATSDFANNVEDVSTRRSMVEKANSMRDAFRGMDQKIRDYRTQQNDEIIETIDNINSLVKQIAQLNTDIVKMESGGATGVVASDLRDRRTERLKELSGLLDVKVIEQDNGSVIVSQKSRLMVFENQYYELGYREVESDDIVVAVPVFAEDQEEVNLSDGLLAAQVDLRDNVLKGFQTDLDTLAAHFVWEFNRVHSQGIGLSGFDEVLGTNSVVDPSARLDELQFDYMDIIPGTFEIKNGNLEIIVHDERSDEEITLNIEIDLDGRPGPDGDDDLILWDPTNPTASNSLVNKLQAAFDSIRPGLFNVELDLANKLHIESLNDGYTFGFGRDTSGVAAALGVNTFFDGYDAGSFEINQVVSDNPSFVTGAKSFTAGDNTGAIDLLNLRETLVLDNDTATLDDFYEGIVGRLGIEGARVKSLLETQEDILTRMENQREDLSGVSLDEELTKMIQFQRSFQSAARFVSTADSVYETLINM